VTASRVVITGVGVVDGHTSGPLSRFLDESEARRLSRICQFTVAAGRLALTEARLDPRGELALLIGTEFGDMVSTIAFVDGYLRAGPVGVSPLLFPHTVMNTMAAATAIGVSAKDFSLTLNVPTVAGELAIARGAAAIRAGRIRACLAGGADEPPPLLLSTLREIGAGDDVRAEGAGFVVLESLEAARDRGATILGEILGAAWRALSARPHGIGRSTESKAIAAALAEAGVAAADIRHVYTSANGDGPRDQWERALLDRALAPHEPSRRSLGLTAGRHSGLAAWSVAAAAAEATDRPALVHAVARGGNQVAIVVAGRGRASRDRSPAEASSSASGPAGDRSSAGFATERALA
jgi:3-oxoacyl-[acyl-carrier-protein] synthase II